MKISGIDRSKFWRLIDEARNESGGDLDTQIQTLSESLTQLTPEEILQFQRILEECMALSYRWDLRAAVHIILGESSDEAFELFRGWLIAQGQLIFENAVNDPESLADVVEGEVTCEPILSVAQKSYNRKTGSKMPAQQPIEVDPAGDEWIEEDLPEMFPRLWTEFAEDGEE